MNKILRLIIAVLLVPAYDSFSLRNYFTLDFYEPVYQEIETSTNYDNVVPVLNTVKTFYDFKSFDNGNLNKYLQKKLNILIN